MRWISVILSIVGVLFMLLSGLLLLALSLRFVLIEEVAFLLDTLYRSPNLRLLLGAAGLFFLLATLFLAQGLRHKMQRERTIAFHNPDGDVTVRLEAIQDFIKKIAGDLGGIKEIKPVVRATRSGILITVRAVLWADTPIPETTETLQGIIRNHIHEILGVEEALTIQVHVEKVATRPKHEKMEEAKIV